ncbi:hypothetical protein J6590_009024 [Homalodisca vitripennis]|nr:hypothetical protein J6590_009024 [Homalodisca vitripennis]
MNWFGDATDVSGTNFDFHTTTYFTIKENLMFRELQAALLNIVVAQISQVRKPRLRYIVLWTIPPVFSQPKPPPEKIACSTEK